MKYIKNVAKIKFYQEKCTGCGMCTDVCPHGVFIIKNGKACLLNKDSCIECGACYMNCPVNAIEVEVGTGCAYAVINSMLKRKKTTCC